MAEPPGIAVSPTRAVMERKVAIAPAISAPETAPPSRYGRIRSNAASSLTGLRLDLPDRGRRRCRRRPTSPLSAEPAGRFTSVAQAIEAVRWAPEPFDDAAPSTAPAA